MTTDHQTADEAAAQDAREAAARCPVDQLLHDEYVHLQEKAAKR